MTPSVPPAPDLTRRVAHLIKDVPDFPQPGVLFKDIMPVLADGPTFGDVVDHVLARHPRTDLDVVAGIDARGFLLAAPIAYAAGCGVVAIRKPGKLPGSVLTESYDLEYGTDALQLQRGALHPGQRVLVVDDVLATGGTMAAALALIDAAGAAVAGVVVLIELAALGGRGRLSTDVDALVDA